MVLNVQGMAMQYWQYQSFDQDKNKIKNKPSFSPSLIQLSLLGLVSNLGELL